MHDEQDVQQPDATPERQSRNTEPVKDVSGRGKWHGPTSRYIPVGGGSRTRVPINDDPDVPRYTGMMGIDPEQGTGIRTIAALYSHLGGDPVAKPGTSTKFAKEFQERKAKLMNMGDEDPMAI